MKVKLALTIEVDEEQCREYIEENEEDFKGSQPNSDFVTAVVVGALSSHFEYENNGMKLTGFKTI